MSKFSKLKESHDYLYFHKQKAESQFIDSLSLNQYRKWTKALKELRLDFRNNYNDARGLRWENLDIDKITKDQRKQDLFYAYVNGYKAWMVIRNRLNLYDNVIEGEGSRSESRTDSRPSLKVIQGNKAA